MNIQPIINTIADSPHIITILAIICAMLAFTCIVGFYNLAETWIESKYGTNDTDKQ